MMRFCSIASGSSGNCIYVGSGNTHILIDAGCSKKKIVEGLKGLDLDLKDIDALFITHEHSDHIGGLKVLLKNSEMPVYATRGTFDGIKDKDTNSLLADRENIVRAEESVSLKELTVKPFEVSHDALEPVCYRVDSGNASAAVATDMGVFSDKIIRGLSGVDVLLLEANHDIRMLESGPYPYSLKRRILGDKGHLSNDSAKDLLVSLLHDNLKAVMLGHLSECNNLPELAYETVRVGIEMDECPYKASDFKITVVGRSEPGKLLEF